MHQDLRLQVGMVTFDHFQFSMFDIVSILLFVKFKTDLFILSGSHDR